MSIVAYVKQVADLEWFNEITIDPESGGIRGENAPLILDPYGWECYGRGLGVRDRFSGRVTAMNMEAFSGRGSSRVGPYSRSR